MLGGYALSGTRCDRNVAYRALIQLDIDSAGIKDRVSGKMLHVEKQAPLLEDIRPAIHQFEWLATSTHGHDPTRGAIKYRLTILPDRDIKPDEHRPILEALDDALNGSLDRGAWALSQAFYLPSCPPHTAASAFFAHNKGSPLPVDRFVELGRKLVAQQSLVKVPREHLGALERAAIPETPANVKIVKSMLAVIPAGIERNAWRDAVWAVAATGWHRAQQLARDWSMTDPQEWDSVSFERVWFSFDGTRADAIGVGTLERIARAHGYVGPSLTVEQFDGNGADVRNGRFFAAMWRQKLLHIDETARWLRFDPTSGWLSAEPLQQDCAAKEVLALLQKKAAERLAADGPEAAQKQLKHIQYTSRAPHLRAMIEMAKSEPGMTVRLADFDADPLFLGVANGVLDLRTCKLLSASPDVLVSKRCSVAYDPSATCPRFQKFMLEVQPKADVRTFLQRWAGYCMTGSVAEQVFTFFFGSGANGKSVAQSWRAIERRLLAALDLASAP